MKGADPYPMGVESTAREDKMMQTQRTIHWCGLVLTAVVLLPVSGSAKVFWAPQQVSMRTVWWCVRTR